MPIYEYHCSDCGADFEELVLTRSAEAVKCSCGSTGVERKHSTFAAQTSNGTASQAKSFEGSSCACGAGPAGMCGMN
jgi:putative FmdB family regulatory protein